MKEIVVDVLKLARTIALLKIANIIVEAQKLKILRFCG